MMTRLHLLCFILVAVAKGKKPSTEKRLYSDLMTSYDNLSRPVKKANDIVNVYFGLSFNQILDLDEKKQVISTYLWISEEWRDENLIWKPQDYGGVDSMFVENYKLWTPDIFVFNTAGGDHGGFVNVSTGSKIVVRHNGWIKWQIPLVVYSACVIDATYFPYDYQQCTVQFGSWIHDHQQIDIHNIEEKPDMGNYVTNGEFALISVDLNRTVVKGTCCPGEGDHPMILMNLCIKRRPVYYSYIVIGPTVMLCLLTLSTFLLPCYRGEKIAIGLTVFLTLYVLQLQIAENVPDTNSTPLIGVFLFIVMTLNCVSLIMATLVMNLKKKAHVFECPPVPPWLMNLCEKFLSRFTIVKLSDWRRPTVTCERVGDSDEIQLQAMNCTDHVEPSGHIIRNTQLDTLDTSSDDSEGSVAAAMPMLQHHRNHCENTIENKKELCVSHGQKGVMTTLRQRWHSEQVMSSPPGTHQNVNSYSPERKDVSVPAAIKYEWFYVAEVLDKFTLLLYVIGMVTTMVTLLGILPNYQQKVFS